MTYHITAYTYKKARKLGLSVKPSTNKTKKIDIFKKNKKKMIEKSKNIDWSEIAFLSTNSAYNLRTSLITKALL